MERVRDATTAQGKTRVFHAPSMPTGDPLSSPSSSLSAPRVFLILEALAASISFAREFNADDELRLRLWDAGFMKKQQQIPPELYYQEARGLQVYINVLFRLHQRGNSLSEEVEQELEERLSAILRFVLLDYVDRVRAGKAVSLRCMDGVVCSLLDSLASLSEEHFKRHFKVLFSPITDLIQYGSPSIRAVIRRLFDTRVKQSFFDISDSPEAAN